jgi:hypothetical protein
MTITKLAVYATTVIAFAWLSTSVISNVVTLTENINGVQAERINNLEL